MDGRIWVLWPLAAALAGAAAASADDLRAASEIESVLVFPQSADITRIGEIRIPEGDHRVIFSGLPRSVSPDSLRARFGSAAIIVGSVEATSAFPEGGGPEEAQRLRDRLQELQDQMQTVDDRIATAELQIQFLQSQASAPKAEGATALRPADWSAALDAIEAGAQEARAAMLAARQERRALEREAEQVQLELNSWSDDLALRTDVAIALTASEAVTTALSLQYQVAEAGWGALYEARLDSEAAAMTLDRKIRVFQSTGEDWLGVRLAVSTAPPTDQLNAPEVYAQNLSLAPPAPRAPPAPAASAGFARDAAELDARFEEEVMVTGSRIRAIDTVNASFASSYVVGGLVDVPSDGTPRTFTIGQEDLMVELVIRTAPRLNPAAFVTATFTYDGAGPLPPGTLRQYRDGAYLREDQLQALIPGDEMELGFGEDQAVVVTWTDEGGRESDVGLIGRNRQIAENHRFEAVNRHSQPFTVEIVDFRPIAQDDDIVVRVNPESTTPSADPFDDRPGVIAWRRELAANETLAVRNAYTITYPSNEILQGR